MMIAHLLDEDDEENQVLDDFPEDMPEVDYNKFYELLEPEERNVKRFNIEGRSYPLKFQNIEKIDDFQFCS